MKLVFFGSGAFGLPTLKSLVKDYEVELVVTQPDRPAGRRKTLSPTPIGEFASNRNIEVTKPENVNDTQTSDLIRSKGNVFVVIAYGQKLGQELLKDRFSINLHGSLLPKYRGAAPINWALINGETSTGVSVITLADRMDAGDILGQSITSVDPMETAGELHDRLADLGPDLVLEVLNKYKSGSLLRESQDESKATHAPKLSKADGTVSFNQSAKAVRARIHGLTPWPGCRVMLDGAALRLHRVRDLPDTESQQGKIGTICNGDEIICSQGRLKLLAVHPPGGKMMSFSAYTQGHSLAEGATATPMETQVK